MDELRSQFRLTVLLRITGLARSTFFYHLNRLRNSTDIYAGVKAEIARLFHEHKGRYGYRRIHGDLRKRMIISRKTVLKLMRELGLACRLRPKKYQAWKGPSGQTAENLLQRDFHADRPHEKWVSDVTEFRLGDKKVYLSPVMDLFNREILVWSLSDKPDFSLTGDMLDKALGQLKEGEHPVLHTDRGWQYQSVQWRRKLSSKGVMQSMSRTGNCYDNAAMESFFGILKSECWHHEEYRDVEELKEAVNSWIEYYNHDRIKTGLGGLSPVQYRTQFMSANG